MKVNILANRLVELRKNKNILAKDAAEQLGLTPQALGHYEKGRREPNIDILQKMAMYYGVSIDFLTGVTEERLKLLGEGLQIMHIPVYNSLQAGLSLEGNAIVGYQDLPASMLGEGSFFGVIADIDSMHPSIKLGDALIFARTNLANDGEIIAVQTSESFFLYQFKKLGDGILLKAENQKYDPLFFKSLSDMSHQGHRIIGKLVQQFRRY